MCALRDTNLFLCVKKKTRPTSKFKQKVKENFKQFLNEGAILELKKVHQGSSTIFHYGTLLKLLQLHCKVPKIISEVRI